VTAACAAPVLARSTAYGWRIKDEEFAQQWMDAYEEGTDLLEDVALERAMAGSDRLLIALSTSGPKTSSLRPSLQ